MVWFKQALATDSPMGRFTYKGETYPVWSSFEGQYKPEDSSVGKFNRYAKLGKLADSKVQLFKDTLKIDPLSQEGRLSYACLLMLLNGLRVGNEESAEGYESQLSGNTGEFVQTYGVTTLLPEHVSVQDNKLILNFLGKKQVEQNITVEDPELTDIGKLYLNDKVDPFASSEASTPTWIGVSLSDLTRFIKQNFGSPFIPKDLRTFYANVTAFDLMRPYLDEEPVENKVAVQELKLLVGGVATGLGNTPAVAKGSYLDYRMLDWYISKRTGNEV